MFTFFIFTIVKWFVGHVRNPSFCVGIMNLPTVRVERFMGQRALQLTLQHLNRMSFRDTTLENNQS